MKKAFITGVTGQDGSYLAEFLLEKDYQVHSIFRRSSVFTTQRIEHLFNNKNFISYHGDLSDSENINELIEKIMPDEIYNLGAQSHVSVSFDIPNYTSDVNALGTLRLLSSIKSLNKNIKFYQASSSELFGGIPGTAPQDETTRFHPRSPYAVAKLYAYWMTVNYREAFDLFACNGILFNHESPRRGETFVTKKITKAVANISKGKQEVLTLGNLDARRDWGFAKDYVECMWLMLQQNKPDDYVIATGKTHSVREFVELAFSEIGVKIKWEGKGVKEKGIDSETNKLRVIVDEKYFRPAEVNILLGNPKKAKNKLNWVPKTSIEDLVKIMMDYDLKFENYGGK